MAGDPDATRTLEEASRGGEEAAARLLPLVYDQLRALAAHYLRHEPPGHTLQPTALVHEAYIRLIDVNRMAWRGRTHFFAMAATQMRRILVEHARAASRVKRGRRPSRVTLTTGMAVDAGPSLDLLALDEALAGLADLSPRQARVAELKLFAGMEVREMAIVLGVSERTVKADWRLARAWLLHRLGAVRARGDRGTR